MDAHSLHLLLVLFIFGMYFLALAYLRRQRLSFSAFALWGLAALLIPAFGPFLVIAIRPGRPR
jgi:hypothetical protein